MIHHVYEVLNHTTGKSYIGCTCNVKKRLREHQDERPHIFEGGKFEVIILESCATQIEAFAAEVRWIAEKGTLDIGYNGQSGGRSGFTFSKSTLAQMSKSQTGRKHAAETIAKIIAKTLGQKRTPQQLENIRQGVKRRKKVTYDPSKKEDWPERLAKMVAGRKGKPPWCAGKSGPEMSDAVKKAWETRRAKGQASSSAQKGWETRRKKAAERANQR